MLEQTINEYVQIIKDAYQSGNALKIVGSNSKSFLGHTVDGTPLNVSALSGIIDYEPTELYIKAYAGTPLSEIEASLAEANQMLAFEPPNFNKHSTIGGVVATGLSGSRRPFTGSVRDYVLGIRCINGKAEDLSFGGQVIKNVAGYDLSRLMTGSYGTLALLTEVTLRVVPKPEYETSFCFETDYEDYIKYLNDWIRQSIPISAAAFADNQAKFRLSGKQNFIEHFLETIQLSTQPLSHTYWQQLNNHELEFFQNRMDNLWRLSVPNNTAWLDLDGTWLIDWGGAQRWLISSLPSEHIRATVETVGGHANLYYGLQNISDRFHPLTPALKMIHQNLKREFDPKGILNSGKMYSEI